MEDDDWALVNDFHRLEAEKVSFQNAQREKHVLNERAMVDFENSKRDFWQLGDDCKTANKTKSDTLYAVSTAKLDLDLSKLRLKQVQHEARHEAADSKKQPNSTVAVAEASRVVEEAKRNLQQAKQLRKEARQPYITTLSRLKDGRKQFKKVENIKRATNKEYEEIMSKIKERKKRQKSLLRSLRGKIFFVKEIEEIDLITLLSQYCWHGRIKMADDLEESKKESLLNYIRTKGCHKILVIDDLLYMFRLDHMSNTEKNM